MTRAPRGAKSGTEPPAAGTRDRPLAELDRALGASANAGLREAAARYRQVLAAQPGHGGALHGLGMVAQRAGRPDLAEPLLRSAVAAAPA